MAKKLSTKITAVVAVTCIFATTVLLCGCFDIHGEKEHKYMIKYMDAIPVTCTEYKLAEPDHSKYSSSTDDDLDIIIINGVEKKIDIVRHDSKDLSLTVDNQTININEEFMAKKSAEYVTISEMWFKYDNDMDSYCDNIPSYGVCVFDNNIFIVTRYSRGGGAWWFRYKYTMPACLFKYDIESDTVLYAGYLMREINQIERTEQE